MPIRRSPNGPHHPPSQLVAITRNRWSQSIGTTGRNQSVRARVSVTAKYVPFLRIWPPSQTSILWPPPSLSDRDADLFARAFHEFARNAGNKSI